MSNENQVTRDAELPQTLLETIFKLAHSGSTIEAISFVLGLDIESVRQIIADDPKQMVRVVESITAKSREYRCALSKRLMASPVMAHDGNFYEQSVLEADPSLSRAQFLPNPKLKAKIVDFSKDSLMELETFLKQKAPQEAVLELTAECLSVLSHETDTLLRVLGAVDGEAMKKLTAKLKDLLPEQQLLILVNQIARELPSQALCLARMAMLEPQSERGFEEAFRCFTEVLCQTELSAQAIDLAEEITLRLSSSQLGQMNSVMEAHPRDDRLERLKLKAAYVRLRAGDGAGAVRLVNSLHKSSCLDEVLRFYDEAGLSSEKLPLLEQRLSASLEIISRESPSVAETISTLRQLLELQSRCSEQPALVELRAEVAALQRRQNEAKEKEVEALQKQVALAEKETKEVQRGVERNKGSIEGLQAEMQDFKLNFLRTEEAIRNDLNLLRSSLQTLEGLSVVPEVLQAPSPSKIFSYKSKSSTLYWTDMETGEQHTQTVRSYTFPSCGSICEVPGNLLFITGGKERDRGVVSVQTDTFLVETHPSMLTSRQCHGSAYFGGYVYVIAGRTELCERYDLQQRTWTAIPPFPTKNCNMGVVVLESSKQLFSLGG
jgi:hypothetical protein